MILARHAAALLWAGRYLERAETTSRCLEYAANAITGLRADEARAESELLVKTLGLQAELEAVGALESRPQLVAFLLSDTDNPGSILSSIIAVRENLRAVRDRIPIELWQEANGLYFRFPFLGHENTSSDLHEVLLTVRRACLAISGVLNEGMRRDEGQSLAVLGKMLERSIFTAGLLECSYSDPRGALDPNRMLRLTSSLQAYHRHRGGALNFDDVVHYLLSADDLPRSVLSCLVRAEDCLDGLALRAGHLDRARRKVALLRSRLEFGDLQDAMSEGPGAVLADFGLELAQVASDVANGITPFVASDEHHSQYLRPGGRLP